MSNEPVDILDLDDGHYIPPDSIRARRINALASDVEKVVHQAVKSNSIRYLRQYEGFLEYYSEDAWHRVEGVLEDVDFVTEEDLTNLFNQIFGGNTDGR